jgi:hypothetical protein
LTGSPCGTLEISAPLFHQNELDMPPAFENKFG